MSPRHLALAVAAAAALPVLASAAPLVALGDNAELFITGSTGIRFDDNVFLTSSNETEDVVFTLVPGLELRYGKQGIGANAVLRYTHTWLKYASETDLDANLNGVDFSASYSAPRTTVSGNLSYQELTQGNDLTSSPTFGSNIERKVYTGNVLGEYSIGPKTSLNLGVAASQTDYSEPPPFIDSTSVDFNVNLFYKFRPKVDLSTGFRYNRQDAKDFNNDSNAYFFNVGARGEISPKLLVDLRVGVETRDPSRAGADTESSIAAEGVLTWTATTKQTYDLTIRRRFDLSAFGDDVIRTDVVAEGQYTLSDQWRGGLTLTYQNADYRIEPPFFNANRQDDYLSFAADVAYTLSQNVTLSAGYIFRTNESNRGPLDFSNNILNFTASVRY